MDQVEELKRRILVARGEAPPDLVLKGGRVVNVFSGELLKADVAIQDGRVAGVGRYCGPREIDARGAYISPGFMDGHMHLESTLLAPPALSGALLARGTTAVMADPHEIANVMGAAGIRYLLAASAGLAVDFYFLLPSCVPATDLETAGATLTAADLKPLSRTKRVLGLGEMMNYPGVLLGSEPVLAKLAQERRGVLDGHAPLLTGRDLNAYCSAGIGSDHECTQLAEAREKLRLGMHVMIRQGTQAKNLKDLLPLVNCRNNRRFSLVTDDLHPHDLLEKGHLDHLLDLAMAAGLAPVEAIRMVTLNTAEYFGLKGVGAVAPGYRADLLVLSSLKPIRVERVLKGGKTVFASGAAAGEAMPPPVPVPAGTINVRPFGPEALAVQRQAGKIRVIGLVPDQILTRQLLLAPAVRGGLVVADVVRDFLKLVVVERYQGTGRIGIGFVQGFGLKEGALAASVAHDSHNLIAVGADDGDLHVALKAVERMQGGLAAVSQGRVLAELPLPIAGLMSDRPLIEVAQGWTALRRAAASLGSKLPEPFMVLSFLALPVIPALKLTDRGLVDVDRFRQVPLFVEA